MPNFPLKSKIIGLIIALGVALIAIFNHGLYSKSSDPTGPAPTQAPVQNEEPKITATHPDPLEWAIITPGQNIELDFNYPLENKGELKLKFDPKADFNIELSSDRKTAKISPNLQVGNAYTMIIGSDTKFDGHKTLGHEIDYHLKTIEYKGV